ncbi:intraflagellar transport protein 140 homolog [Mizuhopecten yessoensis]|uniref:Intraflagellar transport protein 140 n=2 Tax=Mizuhopecten yessoensis TaxID=6573 RepID=A0A210PX04_MIZYE|nr:intraflagellar transport protein 140 homolog [Mizuhopecten yessoensis]OWF41021.1 Intraflagellar transport protein 140 [Mizuhopecten yessoensis]
MAVYFDHRLETDRSGINTDASWFSGAPMIAVTSYSDENGGTVNLFLEEGEKLLNIPLHRAGQATSVAWHPTKKIVAVGWENGELLVWNEVDHELFEGLPLHKTAITVLHWSSSGSRLSSGDKAGVLMVWKSDGKGRLQQNPLHQHHVQEPLSKILYRPIPPPDPEHDIAALARAAVSGDEKALDLFTWKSKGKGNSKMSSMFGPTEALTFFVGGESGGVYYVNENGQCTQIFSVDTAILRFLYYEEKNVLITVTENMMLTQHAIMPEGDAKELMRVKMSGRGENPVICWAGKSIVATATGEGVVRMWDLDHEENYILSLDGHGSYDKSENIMCISYCEEKGVLAGGTNLGNIALWRYAPPLGSRLVDGEKKWKLQAPATVEGSIRQLSWGSKKNLLAVNTIANVFMLNEQTMSSSFSGQTAVVQFGPSSLALEMFATGTHHDLKTEVQVKGVCTTKDTLAVWNGRKVITYEYSEDRTIIKGAGTFATETMEVRLYEQNVYCVEIGKVQVRTHQGTVKQVINFSDAEGQPVSLDVCGTSLVIATDNGVVRVYDLSRREAKPTSQPKNLGDVIPGFNGILSARCNSNGSKVSVLVKNNSSHADPKLYFWDVESDVVSYFNFESGRGEQDDFPPEQIEGVEGDTNDAERGKNQAAKDIAGRYPMTHHWDPHDTKLIVCEAKVMASAVEKKEKEEKKRHSLTKAVEEGPVEVMVVSLFCTPENGILIQDSFQMPEQFQALLGIEVPYYYNIKKSENLKEEEQEKDDTPQPENLIKSDTVIQPKLVARKTMRDFVGLENSDKNTREAMMNFSYYLTIGNMDEAFKSIKLIKSESVWENMAKMCVKSRRLDVASVCLGNMGHARGAKALREAMKEPELDAKVAVLAMQLGLKEDAERLLKNCKRYDLLNEFYQSSGQWIKALETAEMYDRIHLRATYYNHAKHLEVKGDYSDAIPNYEKSDTHRFEVPRMLFDEPEALEQYISRHKDKALHKWWAQYMESTGEMDAALQYYETAQDFLSLVRVYCYCGKMDKASEICNETGDRAACYHLGRQYENQDLIKEAIHFFQRAQAYGNAIRLCKEHGYEDQLLNLALLGRPEDMMEAARYYEQKQGSEDKAVMLYHKAGNFSKALDLSFRSKQFGALQMISGDLDERADPELLQRCGDFFMDNGQYDKAVDLLAIGKKYWEALKICMDQHVEITEDLAEKLTPNKDDMGIDTMERVKILEAIAEVCMHQGQYHLATKKFTQAGNKIKAMKALLKSGDTEKITFFAGVSRQKEIYVMAANYLQSLDWRKDPEIMKNIIGFYTKGRALDSLAAFYDACAQVEIDEYQNYDKALGALGEAYKCLSKTKMSDEMLQEEKLSRLKNKITLIKKFVTARRAYDENPEDAIKQCQVLLEEPHLDDSVRMGDVYGLIIEHYARRERWKAAYAAMEEMKSRIPALNMAYYVNMRTIESVHRALDIPLSRTITSKMNGMYGGGGEEEDGEIVEEEVDQMYTAGDDV